MTKVRSYTGGLPMTILALYSWGGFQRSNPLSPGLSLSSRCESDRAVRGLPSLLLALAALVVSLVLLSLAAGALLVGTLRASSAVARLPLLLPSLGKTLLLGAPWHKAPGRWMQALQQPSCLVSGPVSMPDGITLFSVGVAEAAYGPTLFDLTAAKCTYSHPDITGRSGPVSRSTLPLAAHRPREGQAYVYCPPKQAKLETVQLSGLPCLALPPSGAKWDNVVYDAIAQPEGIYVWVKGAEFSTAPETRFCHLVCKFQEPISGNVLSVDPISCGQEVLVCPFPWHTNTKEHDFAALRTVSIEIGGKLRPTAAFLELSRELRLLNSRIRGTVAQVGNTMKLPGGPLPFFACACVMVYDVEHFIKEWVPYHRNLGIERFFFYDNGSKDNTSATLQDLIRRGIKLSAMHWPWPKTHQSALTHCAIQARTECKWIMFSDVDEFLYPSKAIADAHAELGAQGGLPQGVQTEMSLIRRLLTLEAREADLRFAQNPWYRCHSLGQLAIMPYVFGPSGNTQHPKEGTVLGYTCRMKDIEKILQKVFILGEALKPPIMNRIHYWDDLERVYCYKELNESVANLYHFKYPAWEYYKAKLQRRAPTYTPDLMTTKNMTALGEIQGLVVAVDRPDDWERRFCEVQDTKLAQLVRRLYPATSEQSPWFLDG